MKNNVTFNGNVQMSADTSEPTTMHNLLLPPLLMRTVLVLLTGARLLQVGAAPDVSEVNVQLWGCNGGPNQRWGLRSDGTLELEGRALVLGNSTLPVSWLQTGSMSPIPSRNLVATSPKPVNHTHHKSKWLASNIWNRDVFCYRILAPSVPGVPTKTRLESTT